jgi:Undecaprenyl-phosphate galactose phosphotransferase WbaP
VEHGATATLVPEKRKRSRVAKVGRWKSAWKQRVVVASLVLSDVFLACLVWLAAYALQSILGGGELSGVAVAVVAPSVAVWIGLRLLLGLYPGYGLDSVERLRRHVYSVFTTLAVLAVFAVGFQIGDLLSRLLLALAFLGLLFLTPFVQYFAKLCMKRAGLWGKSVIILSYKDTGTQFLETLEQEWSLGYVPFALFDYHLTPAGSSYQETSYGETLADAVDLGCGRGVDTVVFAMPYTRRDQLASMVSVASESFRNVLVVPNLNGVTNSAVVARDFAGTFAVEIKQNLLDPWAQRLKRALDLFGVVVGGVLISPLLLTIAVLIKLDSPGPVFYGHRRLGAGDKHFVCWKFRTMHVNAEQLLDEYLQNSPHLQAEWEQNQKLRNDPRVTRIGRFLRKSSLDELPQLWNVLWGEMSLTGPRPIVDAEIPKYKKDYALYKRIKPGMSGLWQVSGRSDIDYEERVAMDAYYVRNWSVWLDIIILARTVKTVVFGRGAF